MNGLAELEACTSEVALAVKRLADYCRNVEAPYDMTASSIPQPLVLPEAPNEAHGVRRSIVTNLARLQTMLGEPADFLQHLAYHVGFLFPFPFPFPGISYALRCRADFTCCRTSSLLLCNGWANIRYWPVYPYRVAYPSRMLPNLQTFLRSSSVVLYD